MLVLHLSQLDSERRLMMLAYEYTNWSDASRCIDVLAIDEDQNLVVVELKRTKKRRPICWRCMGYPIRPNKWR
ncbi:MAG: hypothetical protein ABI642_03325 [Polaromonas sp.]